MNHDTFHIDSLLSPISSEPQAGYPDSAYLAERLVNESGVNIFLTGKAGTGKTTFLHKLAGSTLKRMIVLAPTGVAAINAGGTTIHSFFQLPFSPYIPGVGFAEQPEKRFQIGKEKRRIIRALDLIVIDEISMVRPDTLDAIDSILRRYRNPKKAFGGVQLLMIGDLRQLAPVAHSEEWGLVAEHYATPYFFESMALRESGFVTVELTRVYRQQDREFIDMLNKIRENKADGRTLSRLNERADPALVPPNENGIIRLTTHNYQADKINTERLANIDREIHSFDALVNGEFPKTAYPAEEEVRLKVGAQVMFIKNDNENSEYYNGLIATVTAVADGKVYVITNDGIPREIVVTPVTWENTRFEMEESTAKIRETVVGTFTQMPLRLAWAITIHKSQGLTFDRAIIDASRSFAPGQTYVALSRCRSLDGLYLSNPLPAQSIITDTAVTNFINAQRGHVPTGDMIERFSEQYYATLLYDLFGFDDILGTFETFWRVATVESANSYPYYGRQADGVRIEMEEKLRPVAASFHRFIASCVPHRREKEAAELLDRKIKGGCQYFIMLLKRLEMLVQSAPTEYDNKGTKQRMARTASELSERVAMKIILLNEFMFTDFTVENYLERKAEATIRVDSRQVSSTRTRGNRKIRTVLTPEGTVSAAGNGGSKSLAIDEGEGSAMEAEEGVSGESDILKAEIFEKLRQWRMKVAEAIGKPAFVVLSNRVLAAIVEKQPEKMEDFAGITGMGEKKIRKYGKAILEVLRES